MQDNEARELPGMVPGSFRIWQRIETQDATLVISSSAQRRDAITGWCYEGHCQVDGEMPTLGKPFTVRFRGDWLTVHDAFTWTITSGQDVEAAFIAREAYLETRDGQTQAQALKEYRETGRGLFRVEIESCGTARRIMPERPPAWQQGAG